jgi:hypothetical protein
MYTGYLFVAGDSYTFCVTACKSPYVSPKGGRRGGLSDSPGAVSELRRVEPGDGVTACSWSMPEAPGRPWSGDMAWEIGWTAGLRA